MTVGVRRFCIAPMMEWTDRHCRFFHRLLTRRALIYTEMLTTGAVLRGDRARLLGFDPFEHPVALQLGGSDPAALAQSARIGEDFGYDEINLNVGCPSDRVQEGRFGACLMAEPALVADCVAAMKAAVKIPVTVKCRHRHRRAGSRAGAVCLRRSGQGRRRRCADRACAQGLAEGIVAARKSRRAAARLCARAPAEGRASRFRDRAQWRHRQPGAGASRNSARVDGVMMGRAAYQEPWRLLGVDPLLFGEPAPFASAEGGGAGAHSLYRARTGQGRAAACRSPATCLACSAPCPARAPSAAIWRPRRSSPAPALSVMADALALVLDRPADLAHIAA